MKNAETRVATPEMKTILIPLVGNALCSFGVLESAVENDSVEKLIEELVATDDRQPVVEAHLEQYGVFDTGSEFSLSETNIENLTSQLDGMVGVLIFLEDDEDA